MTFETGSEAFVVTNIAIIFMQFVHNYLCSLVESLTAQEALI